ncbi:MAG: hypothetical protein ABJR05_09740 [Balneola sp.]
MISIIFTVFGHSNAGILLRFTEIPNEINSGPCKPETTHARNIIESFIGDSDWSFDQNAKYVSKESKADKKFLEKLQEINKDNIPIQGIVIDATKIVFYDKNGTITKIDRCGF